MNLSGIHLLFRIWVVSLLLWAGYCTEIAWEISQSPYIGKSDAEIAGDDRIVWENTTRGVVAKSIHPLLQSQNEPYITAEIPEYISKEDRVRKIDYIDIFQKGIIDTLVSGARPGKIFIFQIERKNAQNFSVDISEPFVVNSYRLTFSFNENATSWQATLWIIGVGLFISILIFLILLPLLRDGRAENKLLISLLLIGLLFFGVQMVRYFYWLATNDYTQFQFEKAFIPLYSLLLMLYASGYTVYESKKYTFLAFIPALIPIIGMVAYIYYIVYITQQLKFYHHWIEYSLLLFFYLQVCIAHGFALLNESEASLRRKTLHIATIFFSFGSLLYVLFLTYHPSTEKYETLQFIFGILQFVPLFSAASLRLKFGKVSLVLTQTIQYLIFFAFCIFVGILVNTLFRYIFAGNPYQHITELVTSIGIVMLGRGIYQANEKLIRKYFILSQQQKDDNLRSFLAQIPQYTSISKLKTETTHQLKTYLETDTIHIAWKGDLDMKTTESLPPSVEALYPLLHESQQIWSKNKELSGFYFPEKEEVLALNYSLIFTLTVNDSNHGLVLFGKKRSGVYNLSDLEIIGQTLQQVRLTLSVLQFLQREKELLEQTFQANLTALRSQINPHFLFNTLNTISALIHESPDLAEEAVEKLAFIFRYTLKVSNQNFVSLDSEMQLVKTYLDIEKIRFGARLDISIDIDEDCGSIEIPAFVLQTLAENCIKHGIAKIVDKGIISFSAFIENHCLKIEIYDNGPGIIAGRERKGTGLNNIIARLENIYHLSSVIKFENTGNGTLVSLSIPVPPKLS